MAPWWPSSAWTEILYRPTCRVSDTSSIEYPMANAACGAAAERPATRTVTRTRARRIASTIRCIAVPIFDEYDGFLVDLDGVVWLGRDPIPGSPEALATMIAAGKEVVFVT